MITEFVIIKKSKIEQRSQVSNHGKNFTLAWVKKSVEYQCLLFSRNFETATATTPTTTTATKHEQHQQQQQQQQQQ